MITQGVKLTIVARPYFSFSPPRDNEKLGLASQTRSKYAVQQPPRSVIAALGVYISCFVTSRRRDGCILEVNTMAVKEISTFIQGRKNIWACSLPSLNLGWLCPGNSEIEVRIYVPCYSWPPHKGFLRIQVDCRLQTTTWHEIDNDMSDIILVLLCPLVTLLNEVITY